MTNNDVKLSNIKSVCTLCLVDYWPTRETSPDSFKLLEKRK